jgi:glyoxylate carboligase
VTPPSEISEALTRARTEARQSNMPGLGEIMIARDENAAMGSSFDAITKF